MCIILWVWASPHICSKHFFECFFVNVFCGCLQIESWDDSLQELDVLRKGHSLLEICRMVSEHRPTLMDRLNNWLWKITSRPDPGGLLDVQHCWRPSLKRIGHTAMYVHTMHAWACCQNSGEERTSAALVLWFLSPHYYHHRFKLHPLQNVARAEPNMKSTNDEASYVAT